MSILIYQEGGTPEVCHTLIIGGGMYYSNRGDGRHLIACVGEYSRWMSRSASLRVSRSVSGSASASAYASRHVSASKYESRRASISESQRASQVSVSGSRVRSESASASASASAASASESQFQSQSVSGSVHVSQSGSVHASGSGSQHASQSREGSRERSRSASRASASRSRSLSASASASWSGSASGSRSASRSDPYIDDKWYCVHAVTYNEAASCDTIELDTWTCVQGSDIPDGYPFGTCVSWPNTWFAAFDRSEIVDLISGPYDTPEECAGPCAPE